MNRRNLEEFIDLYKSYPCLWQIKSKLYHDRPLREAAYKALIEKLKEFEPDANKDLVVKKINNLRSSARKEKNMKLLSSQELLLTMFIGLNCGIMI